MRVLSIGGTSFALMGSLQPSYPIQISGAIVLSSIQRVAAASALFCAFGSTSAAVLTFDTLTGAGPTFFASNYEGFRFSTNSQATNAWFYTTAETDFYGPHSGSTYVATDWSLYPDDLVVGTQAISNTAAFKFDGAWFSGDTTISYELYSGNLLVWSSAAKLITSDPTFVASGYVGQITSVVIVGKQGYFAMDDFTYNTPLPAVPEPSTLALFALGTAGLGLLGRNRRKQQATNL